MGKKVKVTTKCGETFFYDHNQEVETVEIVESIKHLDSTIRAVARAMDKFVSRHHSWNVGVYAIDHDYAQGTGHADKAIVVTMSEDGLNELMQLVKECS